MSATCCSVKSSPSHSSITSLKHKRNLSADTRVWSVSPQVISPCESEHQNQEPYHNQELHSSGIKDVTGRDLRVTICDVMSVFIVVSCYGKTVANRGGLSRSSFLSTSAAAAFLWSIMLVRMSPKSVCFMFLFFESFFVSSTRPPCLGITRASRL